MTVHVPDVEVVALWLANGRAREVDSLSAADIGGLQHRSRLLLCAIIDGVTYIERSVAPRVGEPLGRHLVQVYALDAAYADNSYGRSAVPAPRMAALLGLHERTVRRVRDPLVELRLQGRERGGRAGDKHWPIIPRSLAGARVTGAWWLDATSPARPASPPANPDTHGCPDSACGYPPLYPDTPPLYPDTGRRYPDTRHMHLTVESVA